MNRVIRTAIVATFLVFGSACYVMPARGVVYVNREPPPRRVEVVTVAPGGGAAWMSGHWAWRHNDYEWVPGHWVTPPTGYYAWVPGHWDHDRHGWFFIEGRWR